jgi:polysaccharide pyruvyl transferase WcaK-like protein
VTVTPPTAPGPRQRIFLVGYYGVGNLGDEAIRIAIERAADRLGVEIPAYASRSASDDPRAVRTGLRGLPGQVRAILASDRVVLGGGGILKDEGLRLPAELLITTIIARLARRRVTLLGVGAGPFYRRSGRWLVRAVARLSHVRTVRDESSAAALRSLGVARVIVAADPIFSIDSGPGDGPAGAAATDAAATGGRPARGPAAPPRAVVSVRPWFHKVADPAEADARRTALRVGLASGLAPLCAAGWRLDFVAMYWPRDAEAARDLVSGLPPGPGPIEVGDAPLAWDELAAIVDGAELVVAMRYHAVAAAALAGRPIVAIAYEPKVAVLAADLGIPSIDVGAPDLAERLVALCASAADGHPPARPDPAALDLLRQRAWSGLRAALLD